MVLRFVKDCQNFEIIEDVFFGQSDMDDLLLKVMIGNNKSMVVGNLYRHQSSSFTVFQEKFVRVLRKVCA